MLTNKTMATKAPSPISVRFDNDTTTRLKELTGIFDETQVKVLQRAINYLYDNRVAAIETEAKERLERIKNQS